MFGRFFAMELGCPDDTDVNSDPELVAYLNDDGSISMIPPPGPTGDPEGATLYCECRGLGCAKCKRKKKAKTVTLTGAPGPVPVMNVARMPMAPWTPQMIMMGRSSIF
jgi:hypothetical protein